MLNEAERQYGPRDRLWTILGIEFGLEAVPHTWYPGDRDRIIIRLAVNALQDSKVAQYQLAHECVHLLSPSGRKEAPVLEEGLAVVFAEDWSRLRFPESPIVETDPKYAPAAGYVRSALASRPDFVRHLRLLEPAFLKVTAEQVKSVLPEVTSDFIEQILAPFYDRA
jgi:hypothetical protein